MGNAELIALLREARGYVAAWQDFTAAQQARLLARIDAALAAEDWTPTGREAKPVDPIYDDYLAGRIDKTELKRRLAALSDAE